MSVEALSLSGSPLDVGVKNFLGLEEMMRRQNEESDLKLTINTKELERKQKDIVELTEKLAQLAEHNFELETELENEELKQKTCSSETQKIFDTLIAELDKKTKDYVQKQDHYKQTYHTELDLNKEKKLLKVKFLNSNQEILIKYINGQLFRASFETKSEVLNDQAKAKEFESIIQKFNEPAGTKKNLKDLLVKLRELFN